jgi:DNA-binding MarR family transcriptional regulator
LREAVYLLENSEGVRPYVLEWFNQVFLTAFNEKTEPSTKNNIEEESISLTTRELVAATNEIQKRMYSTQQMYENYIVPLINAGYIDRMPSNLDKRSYVFYPVLNSKQKILFDINNTNNISQDNIVRIKDPITFPTREYLISKVNEVLEYSYQVNDLTRVEDHEGKEISVEELVARYYRNPEDYFGSISDNTK